MLTWVVKNFTKGLKKIHKVRVKKKTKEQTRLHEAVCLGDLAEAGAIC